MSRAFVREDAGEPERRYYLPPRTDPGYDEAELATGYQWGEPKLRPHVERILATARAEQNERLEQLAERFLRF